MSRRLPTLLAAVLALAAAPAAALSAPGPLLGPELALGEIGAGGPAIARSGPRVLVAWSAPDGEILLRRSTDGGRTFEPAVAVSGTATPSLEPALAADGERVYVAWLEQEPDGNTLLVRASPDAGETFGPAVALSGPDLAGPNVALAAAEGRLHVAWEHGADESGEVLVRSSEDGGATFGEFLAVNEGHAYGEPRIAAAGAGVWVGWDDFAANDGSDVYLAVSTDGGRSFARPRRLAEDLDRNARHVALAVADRRIAVAWEDCPALAAGGCEIRVRRGLPELPDFGAAEAVATDALLPAAGAAGRFLHLLAVTPAARGHVLALHASRDFGRTFAAPRLLGPVEPGPLPAIAAGEDGFAAAWSDGALVRFVRGGDPAFRAPEGRPFGPAAPSPAPLPRR